MALIQIIGAEVRFEAPTITCSAVKGELILAKADAILPTPESSFLMSSSYQMLSHSNTTIAGTELKTFDPYPDQPVEGSFDWGGLIGNVLAGLAVVALVAVAIALTIGTGGIAGAAILGACVVGTVAVVGKGYTDYQSGTVSDRQEYINIGFKGAVAGAVCATLPSGTGMLGIGTMSLAEGLVERTIMGEATAWSDILVDFGVGAFGFGILDNINRKFKLTDKLGDCIKKSFGKTAKKTAAEAAEKATKEAAEKATKEAAEKATKEAAEKASKEAGGAVNNVVEEIPQLQKPNQVHHYATNKSSTYTKPIENITGKYGLDLDGSWNKDLLPHQGRHPNAYHDYVLSQMKQYDSIARGNKDVFLQLFENLKKKISASPDMLYKQYWLNK